MKRDDNYKEFNNQNYLEIKFSKKSTTEESIKEAKKILKFKNKLIFNLLLNKREEPQPTDGPESPQISPKDESPPIGENPAQTRQPYAPNLQISSK